MASVKGRRREPATAISQIVAYRLRKAGLMFHDSFFDVSNAFWSPSQQDLIESWRDVFDVDTRQLFEQRLDESVVIVHGRDGQLFTSPSQGCAPRRLGWRPDA